MRSYLSLASRAVNGLRPERVILVLDHSGSMEEGDWHPSRLDAAIEASEALIHLKVEKHPDDEVGVIAFSTRASVVHSPVRVSRAADSMVRALRRLSPGSSTNITAGLKLAEELLVADTIRAGRGPCKTVGTWLSWLLCEPRPQAPAPKPVRPAYRIIVLTDGEHNEGAGPYGIASRLKTKGTVIDCIGIGGTPKAVNERMLKKIASKQPDGHPRYCFIGDKEKLILKFRELAAHIRPA